MTGIVVTLHFGGQVFFLKILKGYLVFRTKIQVQV